MEMGKFYKLIALVVGVAAVASVVAYYLGNQVAPSTPVPATSDETSLEADRQKLLESLKSNQPTKVTEAERQKLLESLKAGKSSATVSDADRQRVLESLKVKK